MKTALLCLDFENDIVHDDGKVSGKGYADYNREHQCSAKLQQLQQRFRQAGAAVIHVRVGFSADYREQPKQSPLMGQADRFGAFLLDSWGTEFIAELAPQAGETIITKHRVGAFYGTALQLTLNTMGIEQLVIAGVATDMAVDSTAREAHDRDFQVIIAADCCIAANAEDHQRSLQSLQKLARVCHDSREIAID